jgi:CheY-like chemotaxis protein
VPLPTSLWRSGVRVSEPCERRRHGTVATVDEPCATVGSSTLDPTCLGLNLEAKVPIRDHRPRPPFVRHLHPPLRTLVEHQCGAVDIEPPSALAAARGSRCRTDGLSEMSYTAPGPVTSRINRYSFTVEAALPAGRNPTLAMPNLKTFLVEDSPVIRSNLVAALEDLAPVEVVGFAESAQDACARIESLEAEGGCDLAIVDVFLKSGSGLDVLRCMRGNGSSLRRVVLTNYATPEIRAECLALGASRVFDKSSDIEALVSYCNEIAPA